MKRESNLTFFPENKVQEYKLWNELEKKTPILFCIEYRRSKDVYFIASCMYNGIERQELTR